MTRTKVKIEWSKGTEMWRLSVRYAGHKWLVQTLWLLKTKCVSEGKLIAKVNQPSQLIVRGKEGRIQYEHTYPRSSDPRRHKG